MVGFGTRILCATLALMTVSVIASDHKGSGCSITIKFRLSPDQHEEEQCDVLLVDSTTGTILTSASGLTNTALGIACVDDIVSTSVYATIKGHLPSRQALLRTQSQTDYVAVFPRSDKIDYFFKPEQFSLFTLLKSPMIIVTLVMLGLMMCLKSVSPQMDSEQMKQASKELQEDDSFLGGIVRKVLPNMAGETSADSKRD